MKTNPFDQDEIIRQAAMIVCGYAYILQEEDIVRIVSLNAPHHAALLRKDGKVVETSMNDIELNIVTDNTLHHRSHACTCKRPAADRKRIRKAVCKREMYLKWSQMSDNGFLGD